MRYCKCRQCGWEGELTLCSNGNYEPPTCVMCESSSLIILSELLEK